MLSVRRYSRGWLQYRVDVGELQADVSGSNDSHILCSIEKKEGLMQWIFEMGPVTLLWHRWPLAPT